MLTSYVGEEQDFAGQTTPARCRGYKGGSGGSLCTLAMSVEPLVMIDIPLLAA